MEKLRFLIRKVKALSPRASVATSTVALLATKPTGYIRIILTAYLFGASAGMDAYYIAQGAMGLFLGIALSVVGTAVTPNLMRLSTTDNEIARSYLAWVVRFVVVSGAIITAILAMFPSECVWLFASQLDKERISIAAKMLLIMLPMGYMQLLGALLGIWANYKKVYALNSIIGIPGSSIGLVLLVLLVPIFGVYSVAVAFTVCSVIFTPIMIYLFRDIPIKPTVKVPMEVLKKTGSDAVMCAGMMCSGIMYIIADRWFAAGLEAGNITAISYAGQIVTYIMTFTGVASQMYLTHSSRVAHDPELLRQTLNKALAIGWAYIVPVAFSTAALSIPIIRIFFGYGAFDERAIAITAICLSIGALAMPISIWGGVMGSFGLATSRLKLILFISYASVFLNIILNSIFTPIWGAAGIAGATSITGVSLGLYYMYKMAPKGTFAYQLPSASRQMVFASIWSCLLFSMSDHIFVSLFTGFICVIGHLFICERFGWLRAVPQHWRPRAMFDMIFSRVKGFILNLGVK